MSIQKFNCAELLTKDVEYHESKNLSTFLVVVDFVHFFSYCLMAIVNRT